MGIAAIAMLPVAVLVGFLTQKIVGFRPYFRGIYLALVISYGVALPVLISYVIMHNSGYFGARVTPAEIHAFNVTWNLFLAVDFFAQAGFMVVFFKGEQGEKITYLQALLVSLAEFVIVLAILVTVYTLAIVSVS